MDQATHVAIFGGSELLLVQLDRTYYLDRISSWCDRAGYFTKRLAYHLLFCGGLQLHALGGSNRVGYLFLDQGGEMANPFCASFLETLTALFSLMIVGSACRAIDVPFNVST